MKNLPLKLRKNKHPSRSQLKKLSWKKLPPRQTKNLSRNSPQNRQTCQEA